ncbi:G-type lectin S-receptor serine/threonine-protein kinase LECRK1 [Trifolium repens]|nr:G-type lectin S-receptor serine/threonine-protein kinase LECRK1 [Trifolium repens]
MIGEKKNEINLVRVEAQLPDMEIYELIEKMKSSNILFFVIPAYDDDIPSITKALHTGAKWCFRKPVQISDPPQLRRFTVKCTLRSFSFDELAKSTGEFSEEIGRGSFGAVYKGKIGHNNRSIAVKRLEEKIADEGEREFQAEITTIARTHHRNLVKLIGFCIEGSEKLLVYEFVSKRSLANLLFEGEMRLSWKDRLKLALDGARGLLYLHEECEVQILHCNINPRNILMDESWTAKISDFGLARLLKRGHSITKIGDDGASRYLAPELQKEDASVSVKADIYSFGVVLVTTQIRIVTGARTNTLVRQAL